MISQFSERLKRFNKWLKQSDRPNEPPFGATIAFLSVMTLAAIGLQLFG